MPNSYRDEILAKQKLAVESFLPWGPDARINAFFVPFQAVLTVYVTYKACAFKAYLYVLLWFAYKVTFTGFYPVDRTTKVVVSRFDLCRRPKPTSNAYMAGVLELKSAAGGQDSDAESDTANSPPTSPKGRRTPNERSLPTSPTGSASLPTGSARRGNTKRIGTDMSQFEDDSGENRPGSKLVPQPVFKLLTEPRYYTHQVSCWLPVWNLLLRLLFFLRYQFAPNVMMLAVVSGRAMHDEERLAQHRMTQQWFKTLCHILLADFVLSWLMWLAVGVVLKFQLADRELPYSIYKMVWMAMSAGIGYFPWAAVIGMLDKSTAKNVFAPALCLYFEPWTLALSLIIFMDFCSAFFPSLMCCEEMHDEKLTNKELEVKSSLCLLR